MTIHQPSSQGAFSACAGLHAHNRLTPHTTAPMQPIAHCGLVALLPADVSGSALKRFGQNSNVSAIGGLLHARLPCSVDPLRREWTCGCLHSLVTHTDNKDTKRTTATCGYLNLKQLEHRAPAVATTQCMPTASCASAGGRSHCDESTPCGTNRHTILSSPPQADPRCRAHAWAACTSSIRNAGPVDLQACQQVVNTNVLGVMAMTQVVVPGMVERGTGHVFVLSSIAGHEAYVGGAIYCASKHAVQAFSNSLRHDLVATPVRPTSSASPCRRVHPRHIHRPLFPLVAHRSSQPI